MILASGGTVFEEAGRGRDKRATAKWKQTMFTYEVMNAQEAGRSAKNGAVDCESKYRPARTNIRFQSFPATLSTPCALAVVLSLDYSRPDSSWRASVFRVFLITAWCEYLWRNPARLALYKHSRSFSEQG